VERTSPFSGLPDLSVGAGQTDLRTLIVHDYLNQYGGAERVLEGMQEMFPDAPTFTSIFDPLAMPESYADKDIRPSWVNRIPGVHTHHQWALPLYPLVFRQVPGPPPDLVLSTSSAWAKGVITPPGCVHVAYIHSPMRFAWNFDQYCERENVPNAARTLLPSLMGALRWRDRVSARRITTIVANSTAVRDRIRAYWRRDAEVVFPPVQTDGFRPAPDSEVGEDYLVVSRLVPYKRIDIVIETFNRIGLPLTIVGDGRARAQLQEMAGPTVRFLGRLSDNDVRRLTARCKAAVFMSEDDFGISQVEVQAAGRPVIALARGGVLDSVIPDVTGIWVADQTAEALIDAIGRVDSVRFDSDTLVRHASKFSTDRFKAELGSVIENALSGARGL
jgi:glycosyltransferase involved in cell wall biosynthesis